MRCMIVALLTVMAVAVTAQEKVSVVITKADLFNYLTNDNDLQNAEDREKTKRMYDAINASWPESFKLLEEIIDETHSRYVLIPACHIIERKMGTGAGVAAYRKTALGAWQKTAFNDRGLNESVTPLLAKCCTHEDIPLLLDIMANSRYLQCKQDAARGLSRVGDEDTLKEMKRIHLDQKTNEPARYMAERRGWEDLAREMNGSNASVKIPEWKVAYLDNISAEIEKLQKRVQPRTWTPWIVIPSALGVLVSCCGIIWWFARRIRKR